LARPADPARLCLSPIRIQRLTYAEPGEVLTSSGPSWHCRHHLSLTAVLEYGPAETLPPVGAHWKACRVSADPVVKRASHTCGESPGSCRSKVAGGGARTFSGGGVVS